MSNDQDQDIAQTLILTLTEAERIWAAMGEAHLLKEDLALVRGTLDSAKHKGRAELLVVIKKDIYDIASSDSGKLPDDPQAGLDQSELEPGRERRRTPRRGS